MASKLPDAFIQRGFDGVALARLRQLCTSIAGSHFHGFSFVKDEDLVEYGPATTPGPPGYESYSNRYSVAVRLRRGEANVTTAMIQSLKEAIQGWAPDWMDITVGTDEGGFRTGVGLIGQTLLGGEPDDLPEIMLRAALSFSGAVDEGALVDAVALPWFEILDVLARNPAAAYQIPPRKWEEIIAGAYARAGFDEVVLTPHSGDHGRDVIATKRGVGSIRIFDQVKAYKPGHVVTAEEVRALLGTMMAANVSKGIVSTTSTFAPRIGQDPFLSPYIPYRIELRPGAVLLPWPESLRTGRSPERSSS